MDESKREIFNFPPFVMIPFKGLEGFYSVSEYKSDLPFFSGLSKSAVITEPMIITQEHQHYWATSSATNFVSIQIIHTATNMINWRH